MAFNGWRRILVSRLTITILIILLLFLLGEIIFPGFMSLAHVMSILRLSVFLGIVALGQTLVVLSGNEGIDISVGSVVSLGVVVSAYILGGENFNIPQALVLVPLMGFTIGLANGAGVSYLGIPPLVMTFAMGNVIEGLSLIITKGFPTGQAPSLLEVIGSGRLFGLVPYLVLLWVFFSVITVIVLRKSKWGNILYGVGTNSLAAELSGVVVRRFRMYIYAICGATSALAGLLLLSYTGTPYLNLGAPYVMPSIVAVAIGGTSLAGGKGNYSGTAIGCVALTTLNSILVAIQATEAIRQIVYGSLLLALIAVSERRGG